MIEIFIVILIALKWLDIIHISWTIVAIVSIALILVEIRLYQVKKTLSNGLLGARAADKKLDDFNFRLDQLEHDNDY